MPNSSNKPVIGDSLTKLFSLLLAILIWITISKTVIPNDINPAPVVTTHPVQRTFDGVPITVMTAADDSRIFKVSPNTVTIKVSGDSAALEHLQTTDLDVFVNLTDVIDAKLLHKPIRVNAPRGINVDLTAPQFVDVELIGRLSK